MMRSMYQVLVGVWLVCAAAVVLAELQEEVVTWRCPEITQQPAVECSCDMPHTLRCNGDRPEAMQIIGRTLRSLTPSASVSLLDCTVQNVSALPGPLFEGVALHGLVVSSGEIKDVHKHAFVGLTSPLQALGLPNNQLGSVPTAALAALPMLDRLDLSHNLLRKLDNSSFLGLGNLSFLDLSDNKLADISSDALTALPQLRTLRLRGNGLTTLKLATLKPAAGILDLDLSSNALAGPLSPSIIPAMRTLHILQLSHNLLSSLKKGALRGFASLTSLMLQHNQIDVLEDDAFEELATLTQLDLSHNHIVAVSGASLAHLIHLLDLDLGHNFLRAVTADLILPLHSLRHLTLDDNDISIIASDAFKPDVQLAALSLAENPLNCDCSLAEFAAWLVNSTTLSTVDKSKVICTTPPSLENALLFEIPGDDLHCGDDEHEPIMAPPSSLVDDVPVSNARATLRNLYYDGNTTTLEWDIDDNAIPYTCDTIFIYEDQGVGEQLMEKYSFECKSSEMADPHRLNVTLRANVDLEFRHRYRYCIVLFDSGTQNDDVSLILGCSDIMPLKKTANIPRVATSVAESQISAVHVDFTIGNIIVNVQVDGAKTCTLNVAIFEQGALISQSPVNCSESHYIFSGLDEGPYQVCASIVARTFETTKRPHCVTAQQWPPPTLNSTNIVLVVACVALSVALIALIWGFSRFLAKPKIQTHQYFLPPDVEEQQHSRYVKLQATTKL